MKVQSGCRPKVTHLVEPNPLRRVSSWGPKRDQVGAEMGGARGVSLHRGDSCRGAGSRGLCWTPSALPSGATVAATPQAYRLEGTSKRSPEAAPMRRSHLERDPQPQGGNINGRGHVTAGHFFTLNTVTSYLLAPQLHSWIHGETRSKATQTPECERSQQRYPQ